MPAAVEEGSNIETAQIPRLTLLGTTQRSALSLARPSTHSTSSTGFAKPLWYVPETMMSSGHDPMPCP